MAKYQSLYCFAGLLCCGIAGLLAGCGAGNPASIAVKSEVPVPPLHATGHAFGGTTPIHGASVYLYAAGNTAPAGTYGAGATSLLSSAVLPAQGGTGALDANGRYYETTDAAGGFNLTGKYACPAANTVGGKSYPAEAYVVVLGGDAGAGANSFTALIAALGTCPAGGTISNLSSVTVNEVSTVAAVWALQQFMQVPSGVAGGFQIGAPATNLQGLANAFGTVANLVDVATGTTAATIGTASPEYEKINTLADILAYCVNSNTSSANCTNLFASVKPPSGSLSLSGVAVDALSLPADTVQAAWYLARFPGNVGGTGTCGSVGAAFQCMDAVPPFAGLTSAPNDWTIAVGYAPLSGSTTAVGSPFWIAIDKFGNAWLTNNSTSAPANSVVELSPTGSVVTSPVTSYTASANSGYAKVLNGLYGVTQAATTRTFKNPRTITIDSNNNAWVMDYKGTPITISGGSYVCPSGSTCQFSSVAKFPASTDAGVAGTGSVAGFYTGLSPFASTADVNGNVYFTLAGASSNPGSKAVAQISSSGAYTLGDGVGSNPFGIALDNNTNVIDGPLLWVANQKSCTVSGLSIGGLSQFLEQTLSLTDNSLMAGSTASGCSVVNDLFSASTGAFEGIATDAANNLWLVNSSTLMSTTTAAGAAANSVTYIVPTASTGNVATGTAASVTTPVPASGAGAGGLNNPQYVAVDGAGNAWVSNFGAPAISAFSIGNQGTSSMAIHALSGANGLQHSEPGSALNGSEGIAIDASGNVWVANSATGVHYVTVLVGVAAPAGPIMQGQTGVTPAGELPSITGFTASPATINYGDSATLSWTANNATTVTLSGTGVVSSPVTVTPAASTMYTLTATNAAGSVTAKTNVMLRPVGGLPGTVGTSMPRAQIEDSHVTNKSVYDGKVFFTWSASTLTQPTPVVASKYLPYARDPEKVVHTLQWYQANHPTWVVYTCNRTTPAWGFTYSNGNNVPLDITNPDVRSFYYSTYVEPAVQQGYPVVALDNIGLTNWDDRCGHFDENQSWVAQFTGEPIDPAYTASVQDWVRYLVEHLHQEGVAVAGNVTFPVGNSAMLSDMRQMVNTVDLWLDEQGFTAHQNTNITGSDWAMKFNFIRQIAKLRYYVPISKTTTGHLADALPAQVDYAVGNYLLCRENKTLLSVTGLDEFGYFVDDPALNIDLGASSGAPFQDASGIWERTFAGGLVLVNSTASTPESMTLPAGTWVDSRNGTHSGTITMNGNTALMLKPAP